MRISCNVKYSHIFPTKKTQNICNIYALNFNETLTNDIVIFEQPAPGVTGFKIVFDGNLNMILSVLNNKRTNGPALSAMCAHST